MTQAPWTVERARERPGIFVGDASRPPLQLLEEVVGNAVDQHLAGRCERLDITLGSEGRVTVVDRGPGLEAALLDAAVDTWHATPTLDGHRPHVHLGAEGHGLFVVAAFSEHLEIESVRAGERCSGSWKRGERDGEIRRTPTDGASGTRVSWLPDAQIFRGSLLLPMAYVLDRVEVLADTLPRLEIHFGTEPQAVRTSPRGLRARVEGDPLVEIAETVGDVHVEAALAWRWRSHRHATDETRIASFVNYARTRFGGSHAQGLVDAVRAVSSELAPERPLLEGLDAALAVVTADVAWGAPTKDRVASPALQATVRDVVERGLRAALRARPELLDELRSEQRGAWAGAKAWPPY